MESAWWEAPTGWGFPSGGVFLNTPMRVILKGNLSESQHLRGGFSYLWTERLHKEPPWFLRDSKQAEAFKS